MTELLYRHKERLSIRRYEVDEMAFSRDVVPSMETAAVCSFAAELSPEPPVSVPLRRDDHAVYGWPADGIREKIRTNGGSIRFGWRLREWPGVLLTAEFHAIWVDPDGTPADITPAVTGGGSSLFVPDPNYPETFDFDQRPPTRYKVLHIEQDLSGEIAGRIAQMKPAQRNYEERRASKAGKTLPDWMRGKFPADPLLRSIAGFIDACRAFDAKLAGLPDLIQADPDMLEREIRERDRLAGAAAAAIAADATTDVNIDDARNQQVSGEDAQAAEAAAADARGDADQVPSDAAGDETADSGTSDDSADELEGPWLPEDETALAEEELLDWADARYNRRRDILRMMAPA